MYVKAVPGGVVFKVRVTPRSACDGLAGIHGDALKVRLAAPPVDGAANEACVAYLARCLDLPRGRVIIVSGWSSREKLIRVEGVDEARLRRAFDLPNPR